MIKFLYIQKGSFEVINYLKSEEKDLKFLQDGGFIFQIEGEVLGQKLIEMETQWYLKENKSNKHKVKTIG